MKWQVEIARSALKQLEDITDKRVREKLFQRIEQVWDAMSGSLCHGSEQSVLISRQLRKTDSPLHHSFQHLEKFRK